MKMKPTKNTRGGRRKGAGRRPVPATSPVFLQLPKDLVAAVAEKAKKHTVSKKTVYECAIRSGLRLMVEPGTKV